jgi:hypothetical protein
LATEESSRLAGLYRKVDSTGAVGMIDGKPDGEGERADGTIFKNKATIKK